MRLILLILTTCLTLLECTPNIRQVIPEKNESIENARKLPSYGIGFFRIKTATLATYNPAFSLDVKEGILPNFTNTRSIVFEAKKGEKGITKFIDDCGFLFANTAEYRIDNYSERTCFGTGCSIYNPVFFTKRAFKITNNEISYFGTLSLGKNGNLVTKNEKDDKAFCIEKLKQILPETDLTKIKDRIMVKYHE
ncbi:hypothetical protein EHO59_13840 [Leptospira semungkisensis]|uniref:Uncharacterized protein n=1 Tax=Leptospira semungkisensis TaxID=2484985 RepID=A0A4R9FQD0_9LEPT|nr:hypothetical protein [Leptospira semungkisensis]TGK00996.1 hypothetical protein EHO59_13840 [Leptospira semungkisensis]